MFNYKKKDTYTQTDLDELLTQHTEYAKKGLISQEEYDKVNTELATHKASLFENKVRSTLTKYDKTKQNAILKLGDFKGDETPEQITSKVNSIVKEYAFLDSKDTSSFANNEGKLPKTKVDAPVKPSPYVR